MFPASLQDQLVHSGIKAGLVARLIVGSHIEGAIGLETIALKCVGQVAVFQVCAAYGLFHHQSLLHYWIVGILAEN